MQAHNAYTDTVITAGTNPVNAVETVAIFLPANIAAPAGTLIVLEAVAVLTTGATTSAIVARIRRTQLVGGTLVGQPFTTQSGAAVTNSVSLQVGDTPGDVAGQSYCLTLQQTAGTANGTIVFASLQASWLSQ